MAKALELWAPEVIEEALGAEADGVWPEAVRLIDLHVRLPRHLVAMLKHFAERDRTTVSGVLARELDEVASAHADALSWAVPGFADARAGVAGCGGCGAGSLLKNLARAKRERRCN